MCPWHQGGGQHRGHCNAAAQRRRMRWQGQVGALSAGDEKRADGPSQGVKEHGGIRGQEKTVVSK